MTGQGPVCVFFSSLLFSMGRTERGVCEPADFDTGAQDFGEHVSYGGCERGIIYTGGREFEMEGIKGSKMFEVRRRDVSISIRDFE